MNLFKKEIKKGDYNLRYDNESVLREMVDSLNRLDTNNINTLKPKQLMILPNLSCNSNCVYCYIKKPVISQEIFKDKKIIDKIIKDIKNIDYVCINIVGGEPFFYKENMFYFLNKLRDLDCSIIISTNSILLNKRDIKKIIKDELISCLNISLNSDSDELEYRISGNKNRHSRTIRNLKLIDYYKKKYNAKIPAVIIMFAMFNINYRSVLNVLNQTKDYNISGFIVQPMRVYCEEDKRLKLDEGQKKEFLKMVPQLAEIAEKYKLYNWLEDFLKEDLIENSTSLQNINRYKKIYNSKGLSLNCYFPLTCNVIDWDGKLFGCPFSREHILNFNYIKNNNLQEFFKTEEYISYLKKFINQKDVPSVCKNCQICEINQVRRFQNYFKGNKRKN